MKYFTFYELEFSDSAWDARIKNKPTVENEANLLALVDNVLDPVRTAMGRPVGVSSGFRNTPVNKVVGGETTSQHRKGEAADIYIKKCACKENYDLGVMIAKLGKFDQLIFENCGSNDLYAQWIHVSWKRNGKNRNEILKKIRGEVGYKHTNLPI